MNVPLIAPSLLAADAAQLGAEVAAVEAAGADWLHLDIMDGGFVPNLTFGPHIVAALRPHTNLIFDAHLMVAPALPHIEAFAKAGADIITIHAEAEIDARVTLQAIKDAGKKAGLALKPSTKLETVIPFLDLIDLLLIMTVEPGFGGQGFRTDQLPKIMSARRLIDEFQRPIFLEVDGGINADTILSAAGAGADVFVAGTAVFGAPDYAQAIKTLRASA